LFVVFEQQNWKFFEKIVARSGYSGFFKYLKQIIIKGSKVLLMQALL